MTIHLLRRRFVVGVVDGVAVVAAVVVDVVDVVDVAVIAFAPPAKSPFHFLGNSLMVKLVCS